MFNSVIEDMIRKSAGHNSIKMIYAMGAQKDLMDKEELNEVEKIKKALERVKLVLEKVLVSSFQCQ